MLLQSRIMAREKDAWRTTWALQHVQMCVCQILHHNTTWCGMRATHAPAGSTRRNAHALPPRPSSSCPAHATQCRAKWRCDARGRARGSVGCCDAQHGLEQCEGRWRPGGCGGLQARRGFRREPGAGAGRAQCEGAAPAGGDVAVSSFGQHRGLRDHTARAMQRTRPAPGTRGAGQGLEERAHVGQVHQQNLGHLSALRDTAHRQKAQRRAHGAASSTGPRCPP